MRSKEVTDAELSAIEALMRHFYAEAHETPKTFPPERHMNIVLSAACILIGHSLAECGYESDSPKMQEIWNIAQSQIGLAMDNANDTKELIKEQMERPN